MTDIKTKKRGSILEPLLFSEHTVTVEKLLIGGEGLARLQVSDHTVVVFIPESAPQDLLLIKIIEVQKNFLRGTIVNILKPGPSRRQPPCQYATECGGCSWQHVDEKEQIRQKEIIITDLFTKAFPSHTFNLLPTISTDYSLGYRNRIQLKYKNGELGYFKKRSHELVSINDCLIAEQALRDSIIPFKKLLKPSTDLKKYELLINQKNEVEHHEIGEHGEDLSFSQVNNFINKLLVETISTLVSQLNFDSKTESITELYAGSGNFTFDVIKKIPNLKIDAVELNSRLTQNAVEKIKALKLIKNINFFTTKCETFCNNYPLSKKLILLDPPRSGCHPDVITRIQETSPEHIIYISCHPSFLVRDLSKLLSTNSEYKIKHLQIFDMFPQTDHFETVCHIAKS